MKKILHIAIVFVVSISTCSYAQTITTVAGDTVFGSLGDMGPATAAELSGPSGLAVDASGQLYISESGNDIRKVAGGIITTFAGAGVPGFGGDGYPATAAILYQPVGIAFNTVGDLFIADNSNNRVRRIDHATGIISTFAGSTYGYAGDGGPATAAKISAPFDVKFDATGSNLYICDYLNYCIRKVNMATNVITTFAGTGTAYGYSGDGGPATAAKFNSPNGLAIDAAGNVFVADAGNNAIRRIDAATGIITTVVGDGTGGSGSGGDGGPATAAQLNGPNGIAFDALNNLFIADRGNERIRKVNTHGIITTYVGTGLQAETGDGGQATACGLNKPVAIAFDASQNLYIADLYGSTVRMVTPEPALAVHGYSAISDEITLTPNPNPGAFKIKCSLNADVTSVALEITDALGQAVYKNVLSAQNGIANASINLPQNVPCGLYMVHLRTGAENIVSRFVVEK